MTDVTDLAERLIGDIDALAAERNLAVYERDARLVAREYVALSARLAQECALRAQAEREREQYRIEADCGLRDYDALELDAGVMVEALQQIAEPRTNHTFDPWARDLARKALSDLRVTQVRADG